MAPVGTADVYNVRAADEALAAQQLQANFFATLAVRSRAMGEMGLHSYDTSAISASVAITRRRYRAAPSIGIAIIDSGIQSGIDFDSRISAFYDFTHGDIRVSTPTDEYGHGSHVAGLAAGTYVGVASNARLIGLKVLDGNGQGTTANVIRAIEFAIVKQGSARHQRAEPVARTSDFRVGRDRSDGAGCRACLACGPRRGAVGWQLRHQPEDRTSRLCRHRLARQRALGHRGWLREDLRHRHSRRRSHRAYSSRGPSWYDGYAKPDISAPGDNVLSVAAVGSKLRLVQEKRGNAGNYMRLKGTSMAAGVVSGLAALVLADQQRA